MNKNNGYRPLSGGYQPENIFKKIKPPKGGTGEIIPEILKKEYFEMNKKNIEKGNFGRGDKGICGGQRRRDGSGKGIGNRGTSQQPKIKKNIKSK